MVEPSSGGGLMRCLLAGGAVLFPTDTLPALASRPVDAAQLWWHKARPADKPLILMGADLAQLQALLEVTWHPAWLAQASRCWPGPVTLVLPIPGEITGWLNPGGSSLGLRVPACEAARELLRCSGPLATTSANRSGEPAARDAAEAAASFPQLPLLGPLPWPAGSGRASTVLAWNPKTDDWSMLRAGDPVRA
ncbi:MAG: L-threonylcarbamoyladenylate synthase [Synechococcaceae cyanobacterium]|nr:L-threonylcarbamoyladenylate synthase [Synechococcaceae cyanobacterium]